MEVFTDTAPDSFISDPEVARSDREEQRQISWRYLKLVAAGDPTILLESCLSREAYIKQCLSELQAEELEEERQRPKLKAIAQKKRNHQTTVVNKKTHAALVAIQVVFKEHDLTILQQRSVCRRFIKGELNKT